MAAEEKLLSTHGAGFCNLNLFLAHAEQLATADGLTLEFINTPTFADQVTFMGTGAVDIGLTPYTSFMALYDAGAGVAPPPDIRAMRAMRSLRARRTPGGHTWKSMITEPRSSGLSRSPSR